MSKKSETRHIRYSKVSRRVWNDAAFNRLSAPKPNGQTLFFRLLTGPELGNVPGLFQQWDAGFAQALGWSERGLKKALNEILREGLARRDSKTGLFWLPKGIVHNEPGSPNVIKSWKASWAELPECSLRDEAEAFMMSWCRKKGEPWAKAFAEATGKPFGKPSTVPSGNQEQEQEQEQEIPQTPTAPDELQARAERLLLGGSRAQDVRFSHGDARRWPEVRAVLDAFEAEAGQRQDVRTDDDKRIKAIVGMFKAGYSPDECVECVGLAMRDEYWRTKPLSAILGNPGRLDELRQSGATVPAPPPGTVVADKSAEMYS